MTAVPETNPSRLSSLDWPRWAIHLAGILPAFGRTGAILACPDCPTGSWNNEPSRQAVHGLIDHLVTTSEADPERVSLAGYSAGGWGVWHLLRHAPRRFASAVVFAAPPVIDPVNAFADNFSKTRQALAGRPCPVDAGRRAVSAEVFPGQLFDFGRGDRLGLGTGQRNGRGSSSLPLPVGLKGSGAS